MSPLFRRCAARSPLLHRRSPGLPHGWGWLWFGLPLSGCGTNAEDMFERSNAALSPNLGQVCESEPVSPIEVAVNEANVECAPGYCVTRGTDPGGADGFGVCTCRCDGPPGRVPFCRCAQGFVCETVIKPFNLGPESDELAGSYCMPIH